ncbi:hypothetical protein FEM48_Zijuj12G0135500 [Ziziphus jujuba var. spinosa]|uniref:H/ACA ribonucleoprotein complex subunit n=1 Tax=Ziziphus jujuba var. spinosa TaxID=714518 RepID=A0A978UDM1_ZIZJJ|nr:hypothetical protein FEM48_Zijuj12G0135500 [Ziziphus jujuba var. spinosa]
MRPPRGGGGFRGGRGDRGGRRGGDRGGRGFRGGRGGGRGFGGGFRDEGPPEQVIEVSEFLHACEGDAVTKALTDKKVPFFNAPIYLQNKTQIGKVDEIFGPINEFHFSIKMMEGIVATSYSAGDKFFIDPAKLLPLERFLTQPNHMKSLFSALTSRTLEVCLWVAGDSLVRQYGIQVFDLFLVVYIVPPFSANMVLKEASMQNFLLFGCHGCILSVGI